MESSNLLFIVGFLWLLEILTVASNYSQLKRCPFYGNCVCETYDYGKYQTEYVYCDETWKAPMEDTKEDSLSGVKITGDISEIPYKIFWWLPKIDFLELRHTNGQKKQRWIWPKETFNRIDALRIYNMSHMIPPPYVFERLGNLGLKEFGIYRGGKEGVILKCHTFSLFPKLNKLTISETTISEIDPSAFDGLKELKDLNLDSCSLDSIPAANIPSLKWLSLKDNKISSLEKVHFPSDGITDLSLDGNPITSIDSCKWPTALEMLSLNDTGLSYIDLSNFEGTNLWYLEANNMQTLKLLKMTRGVPKLRYLFLSNTGLMEIDPSVDAVFDHADSVYLDITNNTHLMCDYKMHWIAKLAKDPKNSVFIGGSECANEKKSLEEYLEEIPTPDTPPKRFFGTI